MARLSKLETLTFTKSKARDIINKVFQPERIVKKRKKSGSIQYYNIPCSFDIETTSAYTPEGNKIAFMYVWQVSLDGYVIIGREWDEYIELINLLNEMLQLSDSKRVVFYVHNLSFEWQFIRKRFKWLDTFFLDEREACRCCSEDGIEYRCSYLLSGYSLAKVGEHLTKYKVNKLDGDVFDYSKIRTSKTKLNKYEIEYSAMDVQVVVAYIQECIENDGNIVKIPLTKTGYVRQDLRERCKPSKDGYLYKKYTNYIKRMRLDKDVFLQSARAFQGGYTHANAFYVGKTIDKVHSWDFSSSYPSVMLSEKFPCSTPTLIQIESIKDFNYYINNYCCIFDIEFTNICSKIMQENYISYSKCHCENYIINNGRIVQADSLKTTITEVDFKIINQAYEFESFKVDNFRISTPRYLPKPIIEAILDYYGAKTELKGLDDFVVEYAKKKELLNSIYGCSVTSPLRDEILYEADNYSSKEPDIEEALIKYNDSEKRVLYYLWGIYVCAYGRANLWQGGILPFGNDYIYSDTDSIKGLNFEKHKDDIDAYNKRITDKINACLDYYHIPREKACPKTIKGVSKPMGVFDYEGMYDKFRTLGAKRYMILKDNDYSITISGLNKKKAVPYMLETAKSLNIDPFELMSEGLYVPPEATGKNTHTYIDDRVDGVITDYQGHRSEYHELSSVHLEASDYTLSLSNDFKNYLFKISTKLTSI